MKRMTRDMLYYQLASAVQFNKGLKGKVPNPVLYEVIDIVCDQVCSAGRMVVMCTNAAANNSTGKFGVHEPWPDWIDPLGLLADGLIDPDHPSVTPPKQ